MPTSDARIRAAILALLERREPGRTACPSEVARSLDPDAWRTLMEPVRRVALGLALQGRLVVTRRGVAVPLDAPFRGAIRLGLPDARRERARAAPATLR